jgi:hypothetical protein
MLVVVLVLVLSSIVLVLVLVIVVVGFFAWYERNSRNLSSPFIPPPPYQTASTPNPDDDEDEDDDDHEQEYEHDDEDGKTPRVKRIDWQGAGSIDSVLRPPSPSPRW